MGRSFADVGDSSGAFSECNSDRSANFQARIPHIWNIWWKRKRSSRTPPSFLSCAADNSGEGHSRSHRRYGVPIGFNRS
ncbi:hypothetical protein HPP92_026347 [Vanilla planifolia]|uniref:Uncharacterized protein n=1 Tax=Vanilla planifolia TaxID=51239 RepID=A0A835PCJ8_VANPL|nr:hypothetical protein HPP92_026347 [Vanilla planifolia]